MYALLKFLGGVHPISEEFRKSLAITVRYKKVGRKEYLLRAGQVCRHIYFVEKGVLLNYYVLGGKSISAAFTVEGQICSSFGSFFSQEYGIENIRALANSSVNYIDFEDYQSLCQLFPEFNLICRVLLERCGQARERRMVGMWMQPAQDRYKWLLNERPELFKRIAGKQLGSYLGISPVMLSRLKNERFKINPGEKQQ